MRGRLVDLALRARVGLELLDLRELRLRRGACPLCEGGWFVKLCADPLGVRCLRCAGWPATMAMAGVLSRLGVGLAGLRVFEASGRGAWVEHLRRGGARLTRSELWDDAEPGEERDGVVCQDLESLTFADASFDLCTSTEVLEHVADDAAAFRELHRVLAPGGSLLFTVPLFDRDHTRTRAVRTDAGVEHRLPAEYHDDRIRGAGRVLVYREYGRDVVDRLARAGFAEARIDAVPDPSGFGYPGRVVIARKAGDA